MRNLCQEKECNGRNFKAATCSDHSKSKEDVCETYRTRQKGNFGKSARETPNAARRVSNILRVLEVWPHHNESCDDRSRQYQKGGTSRESLPRADGRALCAKIISRNRHYVWCLDSGATEHMNTEHRSKLTDVRR